MFSVKKCDNSVKLLRDKQEVYPMLFWQTTPEEFEFKAFSDNGIDMFTFFRSLPHYQQPYWIGEDSYDFSRIDNAIEEMLRINPNAFCLPRVYVSAPEWWLIKHPEESVNGGKDDWRDNHDFRRESLASGLWKQEMGTALRRLVRHLQEADYSEHIIGLHIGNGWCGEWHGWRAEDTSEAMRQYFINFLKNKYQGSIDALRDAWNNNDVSFDTVTVPLFGERIKTDLGVFKDPKQARRIIDYAECHHDSCVSAIDHFCRIVKQESDNKYCTCVFYSYTHDYGCGCSHEGAHKAAHQFHKLSSVDIVSAPHTYSRRHPGGDGYFRNYLGSLALHGKLFIDESDDPTYLNNNEPWYCPTYEESFGLLRREFGNALTHNVGLWYMDLNGGVFHDKSLIDEIGKLKKWADMALNLGQERKAKVAVISSLHTEFYMGMRHPCKNRVVYSLYRDQIRELCRSGATFDWYLIDDIGAEKLEEYSAYIFLDCFYIESSYYKAIDKLKKSGKLFMWFYGPGFVNETSLSTESMKHLTGFDYEIIKDGGKMEVCVSSSQKVFGTHQEHAPLFVPQVQSDEIAGTYTDSGKPAFVIRDFDTWESCYCASPGLPAEELRAIFRKHNIHIYCDSDDNITANEHWLSIHSVTSGKKELHLPEFARVAEITSGKLIGEHIKDFEIEMGVNETAIFCLE